MPRPLKPFHVLQVNDNQTAGLFIPQHITPLFVSVFNTILLEGLQSFVSLFVEEIQIFVFDYPLKPSSRPAVFGVVGTQRFILVVIDIMIDIEHLLDKYMAEPQLLIVLM
jgi:hypothetical protein